MNKLLEILNENKVKVSDNKYACLYDFIKNIVRPGNIASYITRISYYNKTIISGKEYITLRDCISILEKSTLKHCQSMYQDIYNYHKSHANTNQDNATKYNCNNVVDDNDDSDDYSNTDDDTDNNVNIIDAEKQKIEPYPSEQQEQLIPYSPTTAHCEVKSTMISYPREAQYDRLSEMKEKTKQMELTTLEMKEKTKQMELTTQTKQLEVINLMIDKGIPIDKIETLMRIIN